MKKLITNSYNFIDYKAPVIKSENDFRTSSYLGHRNFTCPEQKMTTKKSYFDAFRVFQRENAHYPVNKTETQDRFIPKSMNTSNYLTLPQSAKNVNYIKNFGETNLKYIPPKINICNESSYRNSYKHFKIAPSPEQPSNLNNDAHVIPNPVRKSNIEINPREPGYIKYLDLMATTNMLTYVEHSRQDYRDAKNHITLWNWKPDKYILSPVNEIMCNTNISRLCPKINKFAKQAKSVPNTGLTTEMKANFKEPGRKFDDIQITASCAMETRNNKLCQMQNEIQEIPNTTEYSIYGSGERLQKYLDVNKKNKKN